MTIPSGQWCTWHGSVADYAQLVKVAYLAAKSVNPQAQIILAGDPYWYDHGAFFTTLMADLSSDPQAAVNHDYFDDANLHLYSRPSDYAMIITLYNSIMAKYGIDKPMWISETNALPYNDPIRSYAKAGFFGTMDDQASYIIEAFSLALAMNVQHIEVNRMVDGSDFKAGGEPFGLVRNDKTVRPEYYAYQAATALFDGVTGGTIAYDQATGVYVVTLHKPSQDADGDLGPAAHRPDRDHPGPERPSHRLRQDGQRQRGDGQARRLHLHPGALHRQLRPGRPQRLRDRRQPGRPGAGRLTGAASITS